jgi:hypothetical protein
MVLALASCAVLLVPIVAAAQQPLDVHDPTPRAVRFAVEISGEPNEVGQTFGPAYVASWSASAGTGTLTISAATHKQLREGGGFTAVPDSFDPIVIQIDLATLEAMSQPASGALQAGNVGLSFTQNTLDSAATVSYIGPDVDPFICTSQAEVDALCPIAPQFCGQLCIPVAGAAYDPATGLVNLVGSETQTGCDGAQCFGPFDFFATGGDLHLLEAPPPAVPTLTPAAVICLLLSLLVAARAALAGRMARHRGSSC